MLYNNFKSPGSQTQQSDLRLTDFTTILHHTGAHRHRTQEVVNLTRLAISGVAGGPVRGRAALSMLSVISASPPFP